MNLNKIGLGVVAAIGCLLAPGFAGDQVRFSSGLVRSGQLRIELEIEGAKSLSLSHTGNPSEVAWGEVRFTDAEGVTKPAEELRRGASGNEPGALRFDLGKRAPVRFSVAVRVDSDKPEGIRILVDHDAPRPAAKPSTASIAKLPGNAVRGRTVFFGRGTCASCHVLDGRGGRVGPDLTQLWKRSKRAQIIESITNPDAVLAEGFETNIIETKDGTPHLGFVAADGKKSITLRDSAGQSHEIDKPEVVVRKPQSFSLMPPFGEILSPQAIADLAAFLGTERD